MVKKKEKPTVAVPVVLTDDFDHLVSEMQKRFASFSGPLFSTVETDLFDVFLQNIPENRRQYYKCNSCRQFINRFGGLVTIDENGITHSVFWDKTITEKCTELTKAVETLASIVTGSKISGVFLSEDKKFGVKSNKTKENKEWTHFFIQNSNKFKHALLSADQAIAEKKEDFKILKRSISEYSLATAKIAFELVSRDVLYRSEKVLGVATWFAELQLKLDDVKNNFAKENLIWVAVANAPAGWCHVRNSMIGTLLDDITLGLDLEIVKRKFSEKMNPTQYQRPQAPPAAGNIVAAEKLVEKLGVRRSLDRRFAKLEEIETIWKPEIRKQNIPVPGGVFCSLIAKNKTKPAPANILKEISNTQVIITWEKFNRTVLPIASKIEFFVPNESNNYCAFVTATHTDSPPILQWDSEEKRNPVSAYVYNCGSLPKRWNLLSGEFVNVTAISYFPWMWSDKNFEHLSTGIIFILENARDVEHSCGAGLFPENLKSELHSIRSTIESYSKGAPILDMENSSACGIAFSQSSNKFPKNHIFKVTDRGGIQTTYKLDRWD